MSAPADQPIRTARRVAATGVRRWPLYAFFAIAYGASLLALAIIGLPSLDASGGTPLAPLLVFPVMVMVVGGAGVALSAIVAGRDALRQLLRGAGRWHVRPGYYLAPLVPPACILAALLSLRAIVGPAFAPNLFPIGLAFGLIAGFLEELGWSGFAYPRLRVRVGPFRGAVVLGLLWGLWHLPVVDSLGAASPHGKALPLFFVAFVLVLTALRVLIAWVYTRTGSLLMAQCTHASSTGFLVVLGAAHVTGAQEALWYAVYGALLGVVAAAVWVRLPPGGAATKLRVRSSCSAHRTTAEGPHREGSEPARPPAPQLR
jgi:membrane protease YdiL (CAAX protease family)